jgi:hypothetical protein
MITFDFFCCTSNLGVGFVNFTSFFSLSGRFLLTYFTLSFSLFSLILGIFLFGFFLRFLSAKRSFTARHLNYFASGVSSFLFSLSSAFLSPTFMRLSSLFSGVSC